MLSAAQLRTCAASVLSPVVCMYVGACVQVCVCACMFARLPYLVSLQMIAKGVLLQADNYGEILDLDLFSVVAAEIADDQSWQIRHD